MVLYSIWLALLIKRNILINELCHTKTCLFVWGGFFEGGLNKRVGVTSLSVSCNHVIPPHSPLRISSSPSSEWALPRACQTNVDISPRGAAVLTLLFHLSGPCCTSSTSRWRCDLCLSSCVVRALFWFIFLVAFSGCLPVSDLSPPVQPL